MKRAALLIVAVSILAGTVEGYEPDWPTWEVSPEFWVYLQEGTIFPGYGSGSGIRGMFSHCIPVYSGWPWVERTVHDDHFNYRLDVTDQDNLRDDLELDIYWNEDGWPSRVDVVRAVGWNTPVMQDSFIVDFRIYGTLSERALVPDQYPWPWCTTGEVVIEDWAGELIGGTPKYGETIRFVIPEPASLALLALGGLSLLARGAGGMRARRWG